MAVFKNGLFINYNGEIINPVSNIAASVAANNFFQSTGITNQQQRYAIYNLVTDLQSYNIWDKMKAIYPFIGQPGVSSSFEVNLKDPSKFRGTFSGSFTFASTGVTPSGINTFMNTGLISSNELQLNSVSVSQYFRNFSGESGAQCGVDNDLNGAFLSIFWNYLGTGILSRYHSGQLVGINGTNTTNNGLKTMSRTASNLTTAYTNGSSVATSSVTSTSRPQIPFYLFARNSDGSATAPSSLEQSFASIGDGLTDTEAANLYTAVQRFQTTLGRQV